MSQIIPESPQPVPASAIGRCFAVLGSLCLFGPLAAILFTVYTVGCQFTTTAQTGSVIDPAKVNQMVGATLKATIIGLNLGLLGMVLVCIAIFVFRFAAPWLRSVLMVGAVSLLPAIPIGTVVAFVLFSVRHRIPQASTLPTAG